MGKFQSCSDLNTRDLISYCIYRNAEHLRTIDEVNNYCSLTEKWEEACRHSWAARRMHNALPSDFDDLIVGCAGFSDCAMEFIDGLPTRDSTLQRSRCKNMHEQTKRTVCDMPCRCGPTCARHKRKPRILREPYLEKILKLNMSRRWHIATNGICVQTTPTAISNVVGLQRTP